jgi:WD40 repeat protein
MVDVVASTKSLIEGCIRTYAHFRYLKEECKALRGSLRNVVNILDDLHDELLRSQQDEDTVQRTMLAEPMRILRMATEDAGKFLGKCGSSRILPLAALTRYLLGMLAKVKGDIDEALRLLQVAGVGLQVSTCREIQHVRTTLDEMQRLINDNWASKNEVADLIRNELISNNGYIVDSLVQQLVSRGVVQDARDCMDQMAELREEAESLRAAKVVYDEELLEAVKTMSLPQPQSVPQTSSLHRGVSVGTSVKSCLECPISKAAMKDPVTVVESGITYDRQSLCKSLLLYPSLEPTTGQRYDHPLRYTPNRVIRDMAAIMYGDSFFEQFDDREFLQQYNEIWNQRRVSGESGNISRLSNSSLRLPEMSRPSNSPTAIYTRSSDSSNIVSSVNSSQDSAQDEASTKGPSCLFALRICKGNVSSPCFVVFDDGKKTIYGSDSSLKVWDLEHQTVLYTVQTISPYCLTVFGNGTRAISGMSDGTAIIWDLENRKPLNEYLHVKRSCWSSDRHSHDDRITCCTVFSNDAMAISGSWDCRLKVWDLRSLKKVYSLKGHSGGVNCCSVFANDTRAISGGKDKMLFVWDLSTRLLLFKLAGHAHDVTCCEVLDDGRKVLSGSCDKNLKVWSLVRKKEMYTLRGHEGPVRCCALLEYGKKAISGSDDATLKVWDLQSQAVLHTLRGHDRPVRCCAVYANGTLVMSGSDDKTLRVWDLPEVTTIEA